MKAETYYSEVIGIAPHVENDTAWIQVEDACHCVWEVTFRRETDTLL